MFLEGLRKKILDQNYEPGGLGLFVNPWYFARRGLLRQIVSLGPKLQGRLLDVGCGTKPYKKYFENASAYIGLEVPGVGKCVDCYYDGNLFPFGDCGMDAVLATQVLEHVQDPDQFLSEIYRILKPEGLFLLTVPFIWDEHGEPFDYWRFSSYGSKLLLTRHGFEILEQRKSVDDIRLVFQLINAYICKKTCTANLKLNLFLTIILMAPFNILGEIAGMILPRNVNLYLDNVILARKSSTGT